MSERQPTRGSAGSREPAPLPVSLLASCSSPVQTSSFYFILWYARVGSPERHSLPFPFHCWRTTLRSHSWHSWLIRAD